MAKETSTRAPSKKVRYRDAAELSASLAGLAKEVKLPMAVALRVALMRRIADMAAEAFEGERTKRNRRLINQRQKGEDPGDRDARALDALEEMELEGKKTFEVKGAISWAVIQQAVGDEKPENLGNIIAGLMPVLDGVPALDAVGE